MPLCKTTLIYFCISAKKEDMTLVEIGPQIKYICGMSGLVYRLLMILSYSLKTPHSPYTVFKCDEFM